MAGMIRMPGRATVRGTIALISLVMALPVNLGIFTGFSLWLSPFVLINSVLYKWTVVPLNILGIAVLITIAFKNRFYCRYLCAAGFCLDNLKAGRNSSRSLIRKMPEIGSILAIIALAGAAAGLPVLILLDPAAIFNSFFSAFAGKAGILTIISLSLFPLLLIFNLFFPNLWCLKICPLGGLQDLLSRARSLISGLINRSGREKHDRSFSPSRRYFIAAGAGIAAGLAVPPFLKDKGKARIRPPASVDNNSFNLLCLRCGNCIKSCPTGILKHSSDTSDIVAWMTPEAIFTEGYCLETCNMCGRVCPSGSIERFAVESKSDLYMATAVIEYSNCLLLHNRECDRCREACPYSAVRMGVSDEYLSVVPLINTSKCVGCGACAVICPEGIIKMIPPVNT